MSVHSYKHFDIQKSYDFQGAVRNRYWGRGYFWWGWVLGSKTEVQVLLCQISTHTLAQVQKFVISYEIIALGDRGRSEICMFGNFPDQACI